MPVHNKGDVPFKVSDTTFRKVSQCQLACVCFQS